VAVLETARLRLRPFVAADEALYCGLYTDAAVMREIGAPLAWDVAAQAFRRACEHNAKATPGHRFWAIDAKAADGATPVHAIGLAALLRSGDRAELGVMLRHGWWNRGISSEAFVPLIDHAFIGMGLAQVYAQRPDGDHARIIDRLLGPFGFVRTPDRPPAPGVARWELPKAVWQDRRVAG
jgi:RimJ/RimL family protein N-acetyltransferase